MNLYRVGIQPKEGEGYDHKVVGFSIVTVTELIESFLDKHDPGAIVVFVEMVEPNLFMTPDAMDRLGQIRADQLQRLASVAVTEAAKAPAEVLEPKQNHIVDDEQGTKAREYMEAEAGGEPPAWAKHDRKPPHEVQGKHGYPYKVTNPLGPIVPGDFGSPGKPNVPNDGLPLVHMPTYPEV